MPRPTALRTIFWAGVACGIPDITAACVTSYIMRGTKPIRLLQGIAYGLLGPKAFSGGLPTAALGLASHFFVAFCAATAFYLVSRRATFLLRLPFLIGPLYGVVVYSIMYWIVMPIVYGHRPFNWTVTIIAIVTHMVCVGTPIVLVVDYFSRSK